jgi:bifunctional DNA-binding transcriptional regulator/antitoxin component of YhaV-PrlF toxin-antitoxin module
MLSTLTSKGQITIPIALRQQLGMTTGSALTFQLAQSGDSITVKLAPSAKQVPAIKNGFGMIRVKGKSVGKPAPVDFDVASLVVSPI